jgi:glutamine amidotransferase
MCRIAGYFGPPLPVASILSEPSHSLREQACHPRELPAGMIGSDGYGFGWWPEQSDEAASYRQILPIWSDPNLATLAPHLHVRALVASTRTAQDEMPVAFTNTPPFYFARTLFVHNGSVPDFHSKLSELIREQLPRELRQRIRGNTDSEYFAALLASVPGTDLRVRVREFIATTRDLVRSTGAQAQLNIIVSDAHQLVATRYAIESNHPSLYFTRAASGAITIASEPLDDERDWTRLGEGTLLAVTTRGHGIESSEERL